MKSALAVCLVFAFMMSVPSTAAIVVVTPETPVNVQVTDVSWGNHNPAPSLLEIGGANLGVFGIGYYESDSWSAATVAHLALQAVLDGSGNGVSVAYAGDDAVNLAEGSMIDGSMNFLANSGDRATLTYYLRDTYKGWTVEHTYYREGLFRDPSSGYVGLQITDNGETYYGWMHLTVNSPDNYRSANVVIDSWAYNTTAGEGIAAGAVVPEPATLALLGLGGVLLRKFRKS